MSNIYPKYANDDDRKCAAALVQAILDTGAKITVDCGEGIEILRSTNKLDILKAMSATGEDWLKVSKVADVQDEPNKIKYERLGIFYLIYANGSEGEPMILISDYSGNEYCDNIWNKLNAKFS